MKTRLLAMTALSAAIMSAPATAQDLLFLAEDVPAGLNYDGPAAAIPTSQTGMVNLMEPLFGYASAGPNEDGVILPDFNKFEGRLVDSWSFDEPSLTWTLNLRQGVKGCGGSTFNADDVIYTFERAKSVSGAAPIGWFLSNVASIAGFTPAVFGDDADAKKLGDEVKKIDDYTVTITQSEPNALFLPVMTIFGLYIFDKEAMEAQATDDDPWSHEYTNNVGVPSFGPYCLESWTKDDEIIFTANEDYYGGAPAIKRVVMKKVPQSSNRVVVLRSGQAQLAQNLTPREYDSLSSANGISVAGVTGNENAFIHMNFANEPFDNIKLRQAIAHAIPYQQIIDNAYFGAATNWEGLVPSNYPGFVAPSGYDYDVEKAKALLAEAGYPNGEGLEDFAETFQLTYVAEKETVLGPTVNIIQTALREIGIPVSLNPLPQTQYGDRQLVKRDLPFAINDQEKPIGVDAGYAIQLFFVSADKGGLNNMVNYSSAMVDDTWAKARVESDTAARDAMLKDIQEQLMADVAWLPIVEYQTQWAFSDDLSGMRWHPDNSIRFHDLSLK